MDVELKPCPFCGGGAYWRNGRCEPSFYVACKNCETIGPVTITLDAAITAWNTRHGAGDADRSAELTTAWMAGAERERERAARDSEDAARYRWLRTVTPYRFKKLQDACIADATDTTYFLGDKFDSAIDAARAGERG